MNKDIFVEKLEDFLLTRPEFEWELEIEDYPFLMDHTQKILLLIATSQMFSFFNNISNIIETTHITANELLTEVGLACQNMLIENIEKDFE